MMRSYIIYLLKYFLHKFTVSFRNFNNVWAISIGALTVSYIVI